jgi:hypothetical protein
MPPRSRASTRASPIARVDHADERLRIIPER